MKTDELVAMLARNAEPVDEANRRGRLTAAILAAGLASFALMMITLGVRPDLPEAARDAMFWVKLGFAACLAVGAGIAVWRLAMPGRALAAVPVIIGTPIIAMLLLAAAVLVGANSGTRMSLLLGSTWKTCPLNITMLSLPGVALLLWLTKDLAPTRPELAGAACGLTAGAVAAFVYALHCPEMAAPFVAIWYLLGIMFPAAIGAGIGGRVLRW